jgi:hypothetical protein
MRELRRLVRIIGSDEVLRLLGYTTATGNDNTAAAAAVEEAATNK